MILSADIKKSEIFNIGADDKIKTFVILQNLILHAKSNSKIKKIPSSKLRWS